jgi:hypothetical protein
MPRKPDDTPEDDAPAYPEFLGEVRIVASAELVEQIQRTMQLSPESPIDLDDFLLTHAVLGQTADRQWLADVAMPRTGEAIFNLALLRTYVLSLFEERDKLLERAMQRPQPAALRPEDLTADQVPLELAAQALYWACYPEVREHFDIATEQTGEALNRVMLGIFGKYRDELHSPDMTLVPEISPLQQYVGRQPNAPAPMDPRYLAGRPLNEQGEFLRICKCCHVEFKPPKGRPNPDFCGEECGNFDHALHTWAWNAVRYESEGMAQAPKPDPYAYRVRPEGLRFAVEYMGPRLDYWLAEAQKRVQQTRGAA